jgi:hypothetical protein
MDNYHQTMEWRLPVPHAGERFTMYNRRYMNGHHSSLCNLNNGELPIAVTLRLLGPDRLDNLMESNQSFVHHMLHQL